jgi:hypothetical protein
MPRSAYIEAWEREIAEHHGMRPRNSYLVNVHEDHWGVWPLPETLNTYSVTVRGVGSKKKFKIAALMLVEHVAQATVAGIAEMAVRSAAAP